MPPITSRAKSHAGQRHKQSKGTKQKKAQAEQEYKAERRHKQSEDTGRAIAGTSRAQTSIDAGTSYLQLFIRCG